MAIIDALRQVTLPTEELGAADSCEATRLCELDEVEWYCTRPAEHDGPHVATYDSWDEVRDAPTVMIGLAWIEEKGGE